MSIFRQGISLGPNLPPVPVNNDIARTILAHPVGAAPLVAALCRQLGIPDLIDREATWDPSRCILSPGERIMALIINLICEERRPLYKVEDNFRKLDTELLFGEGIRPEHLNDDCLGRGLDAFWEINPSQILRQVASSLRVKEALEIPYVHFDTTTRVLYGAYGFDSPAPSAPAKKKDTQNEKQETLDSTLRKALGMSEPTPPDSPSPSSERRPATPAYGHSKDHRPDLKQITIALAVDRNGLPLLGSIKDGNASDKVSNLQTIDEILTFFPPELRESMVYIADSALVTEKNLARLTEAGMKFVSLLPGTFACGQTAREAAWAENAWENVGTISSRKDAASYRASEQMALIGDTSYRLTVYKSSELDKRKTNSLLKSLTSEHASLEKAAKELAQTAFLCEPDARRAGEEFCQKHKSRFFPLSFTVESRVVKEPRPGRGRPPKGEVVPETTVFHALVTVGEVDSAALQEEKEKRASFVLISNLSREESPARTLLGEYKCQVFAENLFSAVCKNPIVLDAFFLKSTKRVDALGHVLLVAAMVYMFIQFKMRQSPEPFDRPPRGLMTRPTTREVRQHLSHAMVLRVDEGPRRLQFPADYQNGFNQILRWTGVNPSVFLVPYVRPAHRRIPTGPPETAETPIHAPPSSTESPQDKGGAHGSVI